MPTKRTLQNVWWFFRYPVERCPNCGRVMKVLFWRVRWTCPCWEDRELDIKWS